MTTTLTDTYPIPGGSLDFYEDKGQRTSVYTGTPYQQVRLKRKYTRGKRYKGVR